MQPASTEAVEEGPGGEARAAAGCGEAPAWDARALARGRTKEPATLKRPVDTGPLEPLGPVTGTAPGGAAMAPTAEAAPAAASAACKETANEGAVTELPRPACTGDRCRIMAACELVVDKVLTARCVANGDSATAPVAWPTRDVRSPCPPSDLTRQKGPVLRGDSDVAFECWSGGALAAIREACSARGGERKVFATPATDCACMVANRPSVPEAARPPGANMDEDRWAATGRAPAPW